MKTTTHTFSDVMGEFSGAFETRTRDNGGRFVCLRDDCPSWIDSDVMHDIHAALDDRLPDDWVYETAAQVADELSGYTIDDADDAREYLHEIVDGMVDVYDADRIRWLADHLNNAFLVDEAAEEFGTTGDTLQRIGMGQYLAISRIAEAVVTAVESELESREDDD